jgi:hypothetical protein
MRIDEAISDNKELDVQFPKAVLRILYRPANYTIAEMEAAENDKSPSRLVQMVQDLVIAWDLTRVEEIRVPVEGSDEVALVEREVPIDLKDPEQIRLYVTNTIISGIVKAIREDQSPGEA